LPLLLASTAEPVPTLTQKQGQASVQLKGDRLTKDGLEVSLSGEPRLVLHVEGKTPLEVELADQICVSDAWRVSPRGAAVTTNLGEGRARWQQEFDLEPLQPGQHDLKLEPLRFREGDSSWQEVTWKPLPVLITTNIRKADLGEAHDIPPIEEVPRGPALPAWLFPGIAMLAGAAIVLLVWFVGRGRLPQVLPLPPEQAALRELERVSALPRVTPQELQHCHTMLSDVIRRYLERRFELPARRQTTPEFLEALRRAPQLSAGQQDLLRDFLERCDLAKFAPLAPPPEDFEATATLARRLIEECTPVAKPSAPPG
jgi:hypothetical protein